MVYALRKRCLTSTPLAPRRMPMQNCSMPQQSQNVEFRRGMFQGSKFLVLRLSLIPSAKGLELVGIPSGFG